MSKQTNFLVQVLHAFNYALRQLGAHAAEDFEGGLCMVCKKDDSPPILLLQVGEPDRAIRERLETDCLGQCLRIWSYCSGKTLRIPTTAAVDAGEYVVCFAGFNEPGREAIMVLVAFYLRLLPFDELSAIAPESDNPILRDWSRNLQEDEVVA